MPKNNDDEEENVELHIEPTPDFVIDEDDKDNIPPLNLEQLKCLLRRANRQTDDQILGNILDDGDFAKECQTFCERYMLHINFANSEVRSNLTSRATTPVEHMLTPPREATPVVIVHAWDEFVKPKPAPVPGQSADMSAGQPAIATPSGPSISDFL